MFGKVLIANRGEIACRVIRALRELDVRSVAVYSDADSTAKHVRMADEAIRIGEAASSESYLRVDRIIDAARTTQAEAIHPGYGFLSESEDLRVACDEAGIVFIGPSVEALRAMGSKIQAREAMTAAGVPVVPGTVEPISSVEDLVQTAKSVGYPVLLKASAGGGGKGMRLVLDPDDVVAAYEACTREAESAFGDGAIYVERAIENPRHIEIQVLADGHGNVVHLFERECSVQRRHQKVVEEAPAANLSAKTRDEMGQVAVTAAKAIGYEGAGTVEFLVDDQENFYFLEMNTRLQVEHPVTELVTGVDLVRAQLRVADGQTLPFGQDDLSTRGHAIECRLYAEDPSQGFLPSPGTLLRYRPPAGPGIRVDDGVSEGDEVSAHYDPMVAKIIVFGDDRQHAIERMRAALMELRVGGIRTNVDLLRTILDAPAFVSGTYTTGLIGTLDALGPPPLAEGDRRRLAAIAAILHQRKHGQRIAAGGRPNGSPWLVAGRESALHRDPGGKRWA
jgi:acetyl-CoA carboxylase biotin carboxylase subunit